MRGAGTLILLVSLATIAGLVLVLTRGTTPSETDPPGTQSNSPEAAVEDALGLPFKQPPVIEKVSHDDLFTRVSTNLGAQFGPGGLMRRARALELLGFADTAGRNLHDEMIAMLAGGRRGWFDDQTGRIIVPNDFDQANVYDRVALHGLLTRSLVHQYAPLTIGRPLDDEWITRHGLHRAVAESVMAKRRLENREAFVVPPPIHTEREALILGLPIYLHQIAQLPLEKGAARIYFETRVQTGARALADLISEPPRSTFELLGGNLSSLPARPLRLPELGQLLLEESLGAYGVQSLVEWLDSYEQAQALALLWRGDEYRLFANNSGDHLLWVARWETPEAAARARDVLRQSRDNRPTARTFSVTAHKTLTIVADCNDPEVSRQIQMHDWNGLD